MHGRTLAAFAFLLMLAPAAAAQPEQVHASWLGDGTVGIAWVREGDVTATSKDSVRIEGAAGLDLPAETLAYIAPGITVHKASVKAPAGVDGLTYSVGSDEKGWAGPFTLSTDLSSAPLRLVAYGDMGVGASSNASAALPAAVLAVQPHAVLHLGDITYADGDPPVWNEWFRLIEPLAARTLYMTTPGNHEHEGHYVVSGPSEDQAAFSEGAVDPYEQYRQRFFMPGGTSLSYSVDLGPVHLVSLNSEDLCVTQPATYSIPWRVSPPCAIENDNLPEDQWRSLPPNQALLDWLDADLAANADAAWRIVMLHRPTYSAGGYSGEQVLQESFAPVFESRGVDLVLSGHDHNYQRSYPLRAGQPAATDRSSTEQGVAPVYIVSGGGGEGFYSLEEPTPAWTAARAEAFHFLVLDIGPDGLEGRIVETLTGEVLDEFTIGAPPKATVAADPSGRDSPLPALLPLAALAAAVAWRRRR
ncbi:MAG: metallophosphoesterase family protein [Thermoplasmatota archaeon]